MKRCIIIACLVIFISAVSTSAHPGRTDYQGGHYDHSTGEYHYHHGYPPHQHPNGVCPYNFDDKTGWSSGPSSGSSIKKHDDFKAPPPPTPEPTLPPTPSPVPVMVRIRRISLTEKFKQCCICVGMLGVVIAGISISVRLRKKEYEAPIIDVTIYKKEYVEPKIDLSKFAKIPKGYSIERNGLPYRTDRQFGWGKEFDAYVTLHGKSYHREECGCLKGRVKYRLHRYDAMKRYKPCGSCRPRRDRADWYYADFALKYM